MLQTSSLTLLSGLSNLLCFVFMALSVALLALLERKALAALQARLGPDNIIIGLLNSIFDSLKLVMKSQPGEKLFSPLGILGPLMAMLLVFVTLLCLSINNSGFNFNFSAMYFMLMVAMGAFMTLLMGINLVSKYSVLGAMRAFAQTISYEISMFIIIITTMFYTMTQSFHQMAELNQFSCIWMSLPIELVCWLCCVLAELHRPPLDFSEGESELVSGFNTEYSGMNFMLIFLCEYMMMIIMTTVSICIFFGGWNPFLTTTSVVTLCLAFITLRGVAPRFRFDRLMYFAWVVVLPLSLLSLSLCLVF